MTPLSTTARIYGYIDSVEDYQDVAIAYSGEGSRKFTVDYLKVLTALEIEPGDLYTDLASAIERHQNVEDVRIECEIEVAQLERITI